MGYEIEKKSLLKNRISPNYYFKKMGLKAFGYKKIGEEDEEYFTTEMVEHTDITYTTAKVYTAEYSGVYLGDVKLRHENKWTEEKQVKHINRWEKYARITPYTDNQKALKYEKKFNRFSKIRNFFWTPAYALMFIVLGVFIFTWGGQDKIFWQLLEVFKAAAIIYAICALITSYYAIRGKMLIKKSNYASKTRRHFQDRIARLDKDYKENKIGYDTYTEIRKRLSAYLEYC